MTFLRNKLALNPFHKSLESKDRGIEDKLNASN